MKTNLWIIILIVLVFLGFMMGYAVPPFKEVGFGSKAEQQGIKAPVDEGLQEYYKELQEQLESE
jgi:hypothetical protein